MKINLLGILFIITSIFLIISGIINLFIIKDLRNDNINKIILENKLNSITDTTLTKKLLLYIL